MKNRMFQQYGQRQPQQKGQIQNGPFNNMDEFFDRYNKFKQEFSGDPNQKLQEMLNSGQMSQEDYNRLYSLASKIMGR